MNNPVALCRSERLGSLLVGGALGAWGLLSLRALSVPLVAVGGGLFVRGVTGRSRLPLWSVVARDRRRGEVWPSERGAETDAPAWAETSFVPDVDETSDESFPASDPPSWSPVIGVGRR